MMGYYRPHAMAVNSSTTLKTARMHGFIATTAGTITVVGAEGSAILTAQPVAVGYNKLPMGFNHSEGTVVTLAGGASGTLLL